MRKRSRIIASDGSSFESARKIIFALLAGLFLGWITAFWFSSWKETITTAIWVAGAHFLMGLCVGALTSGQKAATAISIFSLSLLGWPAWNGLLRQFEALEFYGIVQTAPAMAGGFLAFAIHNQLLRRYLQ